MYERKIKEDLECGLNVAMKVFGAKWKPCIIDAISRGRRRPSEIHRDIPYTSPRVIDMQLRELLLYGIVTKEVKAAYPLNVEYSLTEAGREILPIIAQLDRWGVRNSHLVKQDDVLQNVSPVLR